jgi:serine/threonine protein kinase
MDNPQRIGRYEVIDELGRGAMGSVYRAGDPAMGREVALKTILPAVLAGDDGAEFRERFYREARAAGALAHPGIVPVFDVGEDQGMPFLVMEYVKGQTLAQAMRQGGLATMDRVCEIGHQLAEALAYAHRNGVVHRDIKPTNVLLTSAEVYGIERAKITDFGVAKLASSGLTTTGKMVGTPAFMPPEQFTGAPIDGRTDIFSLGVILYWMTTGEQPFAGETMTSVSYKVVHTDPVPPSKLNPAVSSALQAVILKCLAKNPAERYQNGDDLARALSALRGTANASGMHAAPSAIETIASDATIEGTPSQRARRAAESVAASAPAGRASTTAAAGPAATTPVAMDRVATRSQPAEVVGKKNNGPAAFLIGLLVLIVAGGIALSVLHRNRTAAPATLQPVPQAAAEPAGASKAASAETTPMSKPSPSVSKESSAASTPESAGSKVSPAAKGGAPANVPQASASTSLNPKALDPKQNTRLKFDLSKVPAALPFAVQMDGKAYYKGTAGNRADFETLFAPPGVHEFRVSVGSGTGAKTSNTVSAEFVARKRMSLKVELRPTVESSAATLPSGTQVLATLKQDRFFF